MLAVRSVQRRSEASQTPLLACMIRGRLVVPEGSHQESGASACGAAVTDVGLEMSNKVRLQVIQQRSARSLYALQVVVALAAKVANAPSLPVSLSKAGEPSPRMLTSYSRRSGMEWNGVISEEATFNGSGAPLALLRRLLDVS